jgi:hypothetical protein
VKIRATYSFLEGEERIKTLKYPIWEEVQEIISLIDAESCRLKSPKGAEKRRAARVGVDRFYSPPHLNALFDYYLFRKGWDLKPRINTLDIARQGYREIDALKDQVGVEVQIGKYAFLTYDIIAKMPIFKKYGLMEFGIEICPMASMLPHLSSGIGAFEQVRWDLERQTITEAGVPVWVIGFESDFVDRNPVPDREMDEIAAEASDPEVGLEFTESDVAGRVSDDTAIREGIRTNRYRKLADGTLNKVKQTGLKID